MTEIDLLRPEIPIKRILFTEDQINKKVQELANQINEYYKNIGDKPLVLVGVLKGAFIFFSRSI